MKTLLYHQPCFSFGFFVCVLIICCVIPLRTIADRGLTISHNEPSSVRHEIDLALLEKLKAETALLKLQTKTLRLQMSPAVIE